MKLNRYLLNLAIESAILAGKEILEIYKTDFEVDYKADESPLTMADKEANRVICEYLEKTGIPILSEENKLLPFSVRKTWDELWIVDPLDGTKEFIKKNNEFTVNIALVKNNTPILGVILCPALNVLYFATQSVGGAYCTKLSPDWVTSLPDAEKLIEQGIKLPLQENRNSFVVAGSRSHLNEDTKKFVADLKDQKGEIEFVSKGSSLKLCMIAEGKADIYPRFAPTSEWDIAAGHAIVELAGGSVIIAETKKTLKYNKENILNPWFLAIRNHELNTIKI